MHMRPSGQGPGRAARGSGARAAGQRITRRSAPRPWADPVGRSGSRGVAGEGRAEHRPEPRPSGVRRAAGPARRTRAPQQPRRLSGRAAALGLLVIALLLAYAYPVRVYLDQRAEIDAMQQAQTEQRQRIEALMAQLERWEDPDFVAAQARERLQLVRVGEKIYMVKVEQQPATSPGAAGETSWLDQLGSSVQAADDPPQQP